MYASKQLPAIAFFIIMVEMLMIMLIINATKAKIEDGLIVGEISREKNITSQISQSLRQDFLSIESLLFLTAQMTEIKSGTSETCNATLDRLFPILNKKVGNLIRLNEKGIITCAVNRSAIGIDSAQEGTIRKLLENQAHEPVLHRITYSPVSQRFVAGVHVPIFDKNNEFKGTVGGVIYFNELEEKFFKDLQFLDTGRLTILDDNGDILYNPALPETVGKNILADELVTMVPDQKDYREKVAEILVNARNNRPSFIRYFYPPSPEEIAVYYPVEIFSDRHWLVGVTVPVSEIVEQLDRDSLIGGFANFSALAVGMIAVVFVTQMVLFAFLMSRKNVKENIQNI